MDDAASSRRLGPCRAREVTSSRIGESAHGQRTRALTRRFGETKQMVGFSKRHKWSNSVGAAQEETVNELTRAEDTCFNSLEKSVRSLARARLFARAFMRALCRGGCMRATAHSIFFGFLARKKTRFMLATSQRSKRACARTQTSANARGGGDRERGGGLREEGGGREGEGK